MCIVKVRAYLICGSWSLCVWGVASAECSGNGAAHHVPHSRAHSHTCSRCGHLSHKTWLFGLDRSRGHCWWSRSHWGWSVSRSATREGRQRDLITTLKKKKNRVPRKAQFPRNRTFCRKVLLKCNKLIVEMFSAVIPEQTTGVKIHIKWTEPISGITYVCSVLNSICCN